MPCSEKEMKALMSMFVEIMGLQMNTERLNQVSSISTTTTASISNTCNTTTNNKKGNTTTTTTTTITHPNHAKQQQQPKKVNNNITTTTTTIPLQGVIAATSMKGGGFTMTDPNAMMTTTKKKVGTGSSSSSSIVGNLTNGTFSTASAAAATSSLSGTTMTAPGTNFLKLQQQQQTSMNPNNNSNKSTMTTSSKERMMNSSSGTTKEQQQPQPVVVASTTTTTTTTTSIGGQTTKNHPLFQFPSDLPPPPGGWPEDLLWPDSTTMKKHSTIILKNNIDDDEEEDEEEEEEDDDEEDEGDEEEYLSDVDEDDEKEVRRGDTVVVITTTADDNSDDEDEEQKNRCNTSTDDNEDDDDDVISVDSLPGLEVIPDAERPAFRVWQQQQRMMLQKQEKQKLVLQKRHYNSFLVGGPMYGNANTTTGTNKNNNSNNSNNNNKNNNNNNNMIIDDDDDITLTEDDEHLIVTGTAGIVPFEWGALERSAIEEALEQEERIRKESNTNPNNNNNNNHSSNNKKYKNNNNNKNDLYSRIMGGGSGNSGNNNNDGHYGGGGGGGNSNTSSSNYYSNDKPTHPTNTYLLKSKVDAANKKLGKAVQSWRNRVAASCQANETEQLKSLLHGGGTGSVKNNDATTGSSLPPLFTTTSIRPTSTNNSNTNTKSSKNNKGGNDTNSSTTSASNTVETMTEEDKLVQQQFLHPHLEFLVPYCVPKNRQNASITTTRSLPDGMKGGANNPEDESARELLTSFILRQTGGVFFMMTPALKATALSTGSGGSNKGSHSIVFGRTALDTACFYADLPIVQLILNEIIKAYEIESKACDDLMDQMNEGSNNNVSFDIPPCSTFLTILHQTCQDSGFTALHYAALSGSLKCVELVLHAEYILNYLPDSPQIKYRKTTPHSDPSLLPLPYIDTNDTLTWKKRQQHNNNKDNSGNNSSGSGIGPRQLVDIIKKSGQQYKKEIESHGLALEEIIDYYDLNHNTTNNKEKAQYLAMLNCISSRLYDVEMNGYVPWDDDKINEEMKKYLEPVINPPAPPPPATKNKVGATGGGVTTNASSTSSSITTAATVAVTASTATEGYKSSGGGGGTASSSAVSVEEASIASSTTKQQTNINSNAAAVSKKKKSNNNKKGQQQQQLEQHAGSKPVPASATSSNTKNVKSDDPVVVALLGMGFQKEQIMQGVQACGGLDRATVDDVVAWIFGGNDTTEEVSGSNNTSTKNKSNPKASTSATRATQSQKQEVQQQAPPMLSKPTQVAGEDSNIGKNNNTSSRGYMKKKVEEEEKQRVLTAAAKREEQRRRNREWNTRAQARQQQEDHEKLLATNKAVAGTTAGNTAVFAETNSLPVGRKHGQIQTLRSGIPTSLPTSTGLTSGVLPSSILPPPLLGNNLVGQNHRPTPSTATITTSATSTTAATAIAATSGVPQRSSSSNVAQVPHNSNLDPVGNYFDNSNRGLSAGVGGTVQPTAQYLPAATTTNDVINTNNGMDLENVYSNDTSSIASSDGLKYPPLMRSNIIEVTNYNDDATVSTIGSTPAIIIQQAPTAAATLPSSSFCPPPGFIPYNNSSNNNNNNNLYSDMMPSHPILSVNNNNDPVGGRQQWGDNNDDIRPPYGISDLNLSAPAYVPPSTLKYQYEQQHLGGNLAIIGGASDGNYVDHHLTSMPGVANNSQGLMVPTMTSSSLTGDLFSGISGSRHMGSYGAATSSSRDHTAAFGNTRHGYLGSNQPLPQQRAMSSNDRDHHGMEPGLMENRFSRGPHTDSAGRDFRLSGLSGIDTAVSSAATSSVVPGLNIESFGRPDILNADIDSQFEPHLESSIIESISTGISGLRWENNSNNRPKTAGSSLLLGNVINSNNAIDDSFLSPNGFEHLLPYGSQRNNYVGYNNASASDPSGAGSSLQHRQGDLVGSIGFAVEPIIGDRSIDGLDSWLLRDQRNAVSGMNLQGSSSARGSNISGNNNAGSGPSIW